MYTTGYGLFLSEGQYEEKSHTIIGFSLNKEELEKKSKVSNLNLNFSRSSLKANRLISILIFQNSTMIGLNLLLKM